MPLWLKLRGSLLILGLFLPVGCKTMRNTPSDSSGAYFDGDDILWPGGIVPVCFKNPTQDGIAENYLRDIITSGYAGSVLQFTGWQQCPSGDHTTFLKVRWDNQIWPASPAGFKDFQRGGEAHFPYDLTNWPFDEFREPCLRSTALTEKCLASFYLHEFGHAIGLGHENMRPDRPETPECSFFDEGTRGRAVAIVGEFDDHSMMNRCYYRPLFGTEASPLVMSPGDIETINFIYDPASRNDTALAECPAGYEDRMTYLPQENKCLITRSNQSACPRGAVPDSRSMTCIDRNTGRCVPTTRLPCPGTHGTTESAD